MQRQTAAYIDCDAIRGNFDLACSLAPESQAVAVIKADAYGHGILQVAQALQNSAAMFGVATIDEALVLREGGIRNAILVLEGVTTREACDMARAHDLVLMVHAAEQVEMLQGVPVAAWVKVDTGMHRLGIDAQSLATVLEQLRTGVPELKTGMQAVIDALLIVNVTHDMSDWGLGFVFWHSAYFTVCVWLAIFLMRGPRLKV